MVYIPQRGTQWCIPPVHNGGVSFLCTTVVYPPVHNGGYSPSAQQWLFSLCTTVMFSLCTTVMFLLHNGDVLPSAQRWLFSPLPKRWVFSLCPWWLFSREVYPEVGYPPVRFIPEVGFPYFSH